MSRRTVSATGVLVVTHNLFPNQCSIGEHRHLFNSFSRGKNLKSNIFSQNLSHIPYNSLIP